MISDVTLRTSTLLVVVVLLATCSASPYLDNDMNVYDGDYESDSNRLDTFLQPLHDKRAPAGLTYMPMRRACIRTGGNCDNRLTDCCHNSSCRCNLWGSNCKCQRIGILRSLGK